MRRLTLRQKKTPAGLHKSFCAFLPQLDFSMSVDSPQLPAFDFAGIMPSLMDNVVVQVQERTKVTSASAVLVLAGVWLVVPTQAGGPLWRCCVVCLVLLVASVTMRQMKFVFAWGLEVVRLTPSVALVFHNIVMVWQSAMETSPAQNALVAPAMCQVVEMMIQSRAFPSLVGLEAASLRATSAAESVRPLLDCASEVRRLALRVLQFPAAQPALLQCPLPCSGLFQDHS